MKFKSYFQVERNCEGTEWYIKFGWEEGVDNFLYIAPLIILIIDVIKAKRVRCLAHMERLSRDRTSKVTLRASLTGDNRRGRSRRK